LASLRPRIWNGVFTVCLQSQTPRPRRPIDAIAIAPRTHRTETSTDGLIRRLGARYLFVLVAVALLVVIDQAIVQPLLVRLDRYAPVINLSGRQRMLSQRLTKSALTLERAATEEDVDAARRELQATLEQWSDSHAALQEGDPDRGIEHVSSPEIQEQWESIEPHFAAMASAASALIGAESDSRTRPVEAIVRHESRFLMAMDHIVNLMESEAAREVRRLRLLALGIAGTIVGLIVGLGWFVVRPATRTIRSQVDELETRVAERTAALAAALADLKTEVAEREKVEVKNQRLAAQLAHADRVESIGHLAVGLAHELNHPLGTIANYAETCDVLLNRDKNLQRGKLIQFVVQIREASLRAGKIVRRMRNFVQPNTSETTETDVRSLIDEILALCRPEIEKHHVALTTQLDRRPLRVNVDAIQIQQVLVNLVQNAIQAMTEVSPNNRKIAIRTMPVADHVKIDVVDSGPGFEAADAERIFEPFTTTKSDGLGVGLSICRSIIENHRGNIWAEAVPSGGAVVSFTLPVVPLYVTDRPIQTYSICC
jgi:two-component system, LuxR family, sensor kinase FixL